MQVPSPAVACSLGRDRLSCHSESQQERDHALRLASFYKSLIKGQFTEVWVGFRAAGMKGRGQWWLEPGETGTLGQGQWRQFQAPLQGEQSQPVLSLPRRSYQEAREPHLLQSFSSTHSRHGKARRDTGTDLQQPAQRRPRACFLKTSLPCDPDAGDQGATRGEPPGQVCCGHPSVSSTSRR